MAYTEIKTTRLLGGVEDLLLDATAPDTEVQTRMVGETATSVTVHKINSATIPVVGKFGEAGFKSLQDVLDGIEAEKDKYVAVTSNGGLGIVSGDAGLTWDGGALASNEVGLVQRLANGHYRWVAKSTIGNDNWEYRGKVSGVAGTNPSDYVTKAQLDMAGGNLVGDSATYAGLPAANTNTGKYAVLDAEDGTHKKGMYKSDGTNWNLVISPEALPDEDTKLGHMIVSPTGTTGDAKWSPVQFNPQSITDDVDIPTGINAMAVGPFGTTGTITIADGSTFAVI